MTIKKKLQVFVSSTYIDMIEERQSVVEAILNAGHIPAGMELFKANDQSQFDIIKRWIDESDVFVLIVGGRYGTIESQSGKSYIELEYDYAVEKSKNRFTIQITDKYLGEKFEEALDSKKTPLDIKEDKNIEKFNMFKEKVGGNNKLVAFYDSIITLKYELISNLNNIEREVPNLIGWVRGDMARSVESADEMVRLMKENEELKSRLIEENITELVDRLSKNVVKVFYEEVRKGVGEKSFEFTIRDYLSCMKEFFFGDPLARNIIGNSRICFRQLICRQHKEVNSSDIQINDSQLNIVSAKIRDFLIAEALLVVNQMHIPNSNTTEPMWELTLKGQKLLSILEPEENSGVEYKVFHDATSNVY